MKIVMQDGIKDCGVCCLLSIIRFYGGEVSKEYLREITHTTKDGVSLYNLMEASKMLGFDAVAKQGKLEEIDVNNLPCIVHVIVNKSYKHFVVLYKINKDKKQVILMDPAKGRKQISFSEFNLLTSSHYLFLKPIKKLPIIKKKNIVYKVIKKSIITNKKMLLLITFLTLSYFILCIISSLHFKYILEYSINYNNTYNGKILSLIILIMYIMKNINLFLRNTLLNKWTLIFDDISTSLTFNQMLLLPYLYYKNRTSGEIISRFRDLSTIRGFISKLFCICTTDIITVIIFLIIMLTYQKTITLIICSILCLIIFYNILINKKKKKYIYNINKGQDRVNSYLIQGLSNVDTIKGSHLEKRMVDKFNICYKNFLENIYKYQFLLEKNTLLKNMILDLILVVIYGMGTISIIKEKLTLANLIIFQLIFQYFINSYYNILSIVEEYSSYKAAKDRIEEIFMINKDTFENNYFYLSYNLDGSIIYNNLSITNGCHMLFNKLSWQIEKGSKILLSGDSGSGKSTLLKILLRYVEVPFDTVSIAGIDINHYHLENIRSNITYVSSNEYLFFDTIRNNIMLYKEYKEDEFINVCKLCLVDDLIKNNITGYDSMIEENGFNFSNGERQRIVLARAIIRKSSIYIFDEALSGIDINREKKILNNIFLYLKDKTIIVISHRFNNKKLFDKIYKLENGKINEC